MGYLLDQMEKVASLAGEAMTKRAATANPQASSNDARTERLLNGIGGGILLSGAGGGAAILPSQFETLRTNAQKLFEPAQHSQLLIDAQKARDAGDAAKATKLVNRYNSPMYRAWHGFKAHSLPGKLKLLAPILGTAAGVAGLGAVGMHGIDKAFNG